MGRIVKNHSTHIDGLIKVLTKLAKIDGVNSVTPGVLKRVNSNCEKLTLRISREVRGGFKMVARKGKMAQEVYILTDLLEDELETLINKSMGREA